MAPMYVGWKCFPRKKALISSLIFTANGSGSVLYSIFAGMIVNPKNLPPTIEVQEGNTVRHYYNHDVADNTIWLFRFFAAVAAFTMLVCLITVYIPPSVLRERKNQVKSKTNFNKMLKKAVFSP
jgi:hypothetical protein